ncbi:unnamed protein product [Linum trigynum]|uniref:Uncharacterized protein n=1 Tax=Linum trigynum TaxID=586398 RepID=A0AAV2DIW5_9ROSI
MHHVPPPIVELKDICHMKRPGLHLDIRFHRNPGHASQDPDPHVSNLKLDSLLPPVERELPALYHSVVPNAMAE